MSKIRLGEFSRYVENLYIDFLVMSKIYIIVVLLWNIFSFLIMLEKSSCHIIMARTKTTKGAKTMTVSKDLQEQTKTELLKEGKALGLFEGITGRNLASIGKADMIVQILDAKSKSSGTREIVIGGATKKKKAKRVAKKKPSAPKEKGIYDDEPVSSLLKKCKEREIEACVGKKTMPKKDLIPILERWDEEMAKREKAESPKEKKIRKKTKRIAKKKTAPAREACSSEQVLVLETGKCVKKTKSGAPYGEAALKKKYGEDYVYDAELGVVGRQAEVESYRSEMVVTPEAPKKKVAKKAKRCDDLEDPVICGDKKVCKADTGRCVADTAAAKKGMSSLKVDDRTIIGDIHTLEKLKDILGGTITTAEKQKVKKVPKKKVTPKKVTPKKKTPPGSPKDISDIEERLETLISGAEKAAKGEIAKLRKKLAEAKGVEKPEPKVAKKVKRKVPTPKKKTPPPPKKVSTPKKKTPSPLKKVPTPAKKTPKKKTPSPKKPAGFKVELKKQEIFDTFQKCLANLQA
jgi:hypothetical protein